MWYIKGTNPDGVTETIDDCDTEADAEDLVQKYSTVFHNWVIWCEGNKSYSPFEDTIEYHRRFV